MKKGIILNDISTLKVKDSIVKIVGEDKLNYTAILLEKGNKRCIAKVGTKLCINKCNIKII